MFLGSHTHGRSRRPIPVACGTGPRARLLGPWNRAARALLGILAFQRGGVAELKSNTISRIRRNTIKNEAK